MPGQPIGKGFMEKLYNAKTTEHFPLRGNQDLARIILIWHLINLFTLTKSNDDFFAQSIHIRLSLPPAAQLSLFYKKISSVAPP